MCRCVRMYSEASLRARPEFATDDIDRNPLYGPLLQSIGAGLDPHDLLRGQRTERILSDMAYLRERGLIEPAPSLSAVEGKDGSNPSGFRVTATGRVVVSLPLSVDAGRLLYLCLVGGARSVQLSDRSGWLLVVLACWLDLQARPFFVLSPAQFKRSAAQSAAFACYADYVRDVHERFHARFSAGCDFHSALMVYVTMTEEIAAAVGGVRKWAAPSSNHMNAKVCAEWHRSVRRTLQALSRRLGLSRLERGAHWRFLDDEKGAAGRDEGLGDLIRAHTERRVAGAPRLLSEGLPGARVRAPRPRATRSSGWRPLHPAPPSPARTAIKSSSGWTSSRATGAVASRRESHFRVRCSRHQREDLRS